MIETIDRQSGPNTIEIRPLTGIGEVHAGDNIASMIVNAIQGGVSSIEADDIFVITQKIVSKSEDRWVDLATIKPSAQAIDYAALVKKDPRLVEQVLRESSAVVRAAPHVLITRHRCGFVMANAGIDQSNVGDDSDNRALLLPVDPDRSARQLCAALAALIGWPPPVVITDSFGRPWRHGVVPVAIGAAGLPALYDRRGEKDRDGRVLAVTQTAVADLIAAAAGLVTGEGAEGIPAAIIKGLKLPPGDRPAADLIRPPEEDLFR
jgi:coenzyme F420-0:L-glutamate ligase/coenzyme F420-1:gamma-L-glutamate ligase